MWLIDQTLMLYGPIWTCYLGAMKNYLEWQTRVRNFCQERDWDQFHSLKDLAIGLSTEAAEALELFRFKSEAESQAHLENTDLRSRLGDELADCLYFILRLADKTGLDLDQCLESKMAKNAKKYPVEEFRGKNHKYDEIT